MWIIEIYWSINRESLLVYEIRTTLGSPSMQWKFRVCDLDLCIYPDDLHVIAQLVPAFQLKISIYDEIQDSWGRPIWTVLTLFGWTCMLNGFVMLNTLNKNGRAGIPPIEELSSAITFARDSPDDFNFDGPETWSPILEMKRIH